jgi:uncharacterized protein YjbI with pentapeptide repeats
MPHPLTPANQGKEVTKIQIRSRWNSDTILFECDAPEGLDSGLHMRHALEQATAARADLRGADLRGADLSDADLRGADLSDADLSGADLRGADLSDADLSDAYLSGADLRGADLRGADLRGADLSGAPALPNIHQTVYAVACIPGALNMDSWHCGTSHCRAGWVVTLAGEEGKALEDKIGTAAAAMSIYMASDPDRWKTERLPNFFASNEKALADMKRMAEEEAAVKP